MNLLYATDYRRCTVRSTLIDAPVALALIVMLLWFGSLRNPDPVSADEARQFQECPASSLEPCEDLALASPVRTGNWATQDNGAGRL